MSKKRKWELRHDMLAPKIWAKLPEQDRVLRQIQRSLAQRQADYAAGKGSLLGEKELKAWRVYRAKLTELTDVKKEVLQYFDESEAALVKAKAEEKRKQKEEIEKERQLREEAQQSEMRAKQRTRLAVTAFLTALGLVILTVIFWQQSRELTGELGVNKQELENNIKELQHKETALQESLKEAQQAKDTAEKRRKQAEESKDLANEQTFVAQEALIEAKEAKDTAEVRRLQALASRDSTKEALLLADSLQTIAEAEAEKAKRALTDKEAYARQAMPVLLQDIENLILRLQYDTALVRCQTAWNLDPKNREVAQHFQEIAFFFTESHAYPKAEAALTYIDYKPDQLSQEPGLYREELLSAVQRIDPKYFLDSLQSRYYGDMVAIEGGSFCMGRDPKVTGPCDTKGVEVLLDDFRLARTEVTVWQYHLYCQASGQDSLDRIQAGLDWELQGNYPIVKVNWYDAARYTNWVNRRMGQDTLYNFVRPLDEDNWVVSLNPGIKNAFRLPTEAEWEYAARGGVNKDITTYSGSNDLNEVAWNYDNSAGRTHSVAGKKANSLGLHDLSGNVWEWCWDWYQDTLEPGNNPLGPVSGSSRVLRGGSWLYNYSWIYEVSNRNREDPYYRGSNGVGFRLAQD